MRINAHNTADVKRIHAQRISAPNLALLPLMENAKREIIESQQRMLEEILSAAATTPTELARLAKLSPSTLNRFRLPKAPKFALTSVTLIQLASAIRRLLDEHRGAMSDADKEKLQRIVDAISGKQVVPFLGNTAPVSLIGAVQAGAWVEATQWPEEEHRSFTIPLDKFGPNVRRFALLVAGPSMNMVYPEGTILICVPFPEVGRGPNPAEKVICQRTRKDGLVEATVKIFDYDASGRPWLFPRSTDPAFQQPMPLEPQNGEESVEITALVVGAYRSE